ncbi:MAG: PAS domain S-box protein [Candidatus Thermoplasmatota archaeon]
MPINTLLVDDEKSLLEQAEVFLERLEEEIDIVPVSSAEKALNVMDEKNFDVIVSDYQMPEKDGLEFLEELREKKNSDLPFIMFTGKGREEVAMKALNLGADRYLQKGGDPSAQYNVLAQAIEQEVEHHRTELNLEESEERYRKLVETTGDIIIIHDKKGSIKFVNQAGLDFAGYSVEEVKGKNITDFLPEDEIPDLIERKKKRVEEEVKDRLKYQTAFINKDGERIDVDVEATALLDEGEYKESLVIARDITERKMAEQKLKENRSRLNRSQKVAKVGSWEIDLETDELTWSDETYSIFEIPKDKSMDYQDFLDKIHPEDRDYVDEKWEEGLEDGEYDIEHRIIADGKTKWVREKADIKYDDEGKPIEVIGSVQDITERKMAEKKLEESEERYRRLFETAQDGMLIIDAETGIIEDANPFIQDILGYSKEELFGKELWELGTFESIIENKRRFEELVEEGYIRYEDKPLETKDGDEIPVEFVSNTYEAGGKEVVQCNIREISERKKVEEEIKYLENLERIITKISTELVNIEVEEIDENIDQALKKIGEFADADRSYFFQFYEDLEKMDMTHERCTEGVEPQKGNMQNFSTDNLPWLIEKVKKFENITLPKVSELPPEAEAFEELLHKQNIKSLLVLPIISDDDLKGLIGFDWVKKEEEWSEDVVDLLRIAGETIQSALDRKETEEKLKRSEKKFRSSFEASPDPTFLLDKDGVFEDVNQVALKKLGYEKEEIVGKSLEEVPFFREEMLEKTKEKFEKRKKGEDVPPYEIDMLGKDGDRLFVEVNVGTFERDRFEGEIVIARDITERKEVEEKLRESKQRLDLALKGAELGVWDWNVKTDEVKYSEQWAKMLGHSPDEIEQDLDSWEKRVHPDELPRVKEELEKHLERKTDLYKTEHRMKTKSGDWIWVKDVGKVFERDENGEPVRAVGIHEDITDRKRSEQKLKKREEKYRTIFESANDAIFIVKKDRYIDCNEKALEMFECDREDIIGKSPYEFSPEKQPDGSDSREKAMEKINSALKGEPQNFEWVHTTKAGESFHADITVTKYMVDDEKFVMGIVRDITEWKEAQELIEENKEKLEKLQEISTKLEGYKSEEEVYSFAIKAAEDILEFDICEINVLEDDKMRHVVRSHAFPEEGSSKLNPLPIDDSVAGKTYLKNSSFLVKDIQKHEEANPTLEEFKSAISVPLGDYGVFQALSTEVNHFDEEDLRMAELLMGHVSEALKRVQAKEKEKFLHSLLRHDVGNKNQIIRGYLEMMKKHDIPDELKKLVDKAEVAARNSREIIDKVRKLRKIEKEKKISKVHLSSVIDKVLSGHQNQLERRGINIDLSKCDCKVMGGALLEELFSNLIKNSIQHSNCDGIRINSQIEENKCLVTVEDDGVGISDEMKDKIFEKGFKDGESSGTGLGLYMVKEIAESYGGSVEVKDSEMGGARFDIALEKAENLND